MGGSKAEWRTRLGPGAASAARPTGRDGIAHLSSHDYGRLRELENVLFGQKK